MNFHSIQGPSYQGDVFVDRVDHEEAKSVEPPLLPQPSVDTTSVNTTFTTRKAPIDEVLFQELERALHLQATDIERELTALERSKKNQSLIKSLVETENWGVSSHQSYDKTKETIRDGLKFLEYVLPPHLFTKLPHYSKVEEFGRLTSLSSTFLNAVDAGAQGLALICQTKILDHSRKLLSKFQDTFLNSSHAIEMTEAEKQELASLHPSGIEEALLEWEARLALEEEHLAEEKRKFKMNILSNTLSILNIPLTYLPKEAILEFVHLAELAEASISFGLSGIELLTAGIELHESKEEVETFHEWAEAYKKWQDKYLPKVNISNHSTARDTSSLLTLSAIFEKAKDLSEIRYYLKEELHVELDSSLHSKEEFQSYLIDHPAYCLQLMSAYIRAQRKEALDVIIKTSKDLLEKREAIITKKLLLLAPHFSKFEPKIRESKKAIFVGDMQNVLWQQLQDPKCSPFKIKEKLEKWGFFHTPSAKIQGVLQAFAQFEIASKEKASEALQHLQQEFYQWMNHPIAMDEQFHAWYQTQSRDSLLHFYVDHQETLEHTVKNALKQMVQKKHEIEKRFIEFKLTKAKIHFSVATIGLTVSVGLVILGILTTPLAGAGLILLIVSLGSTAVSLGLLGASYYQAYHEKPHTTQLLTLRYQAKMTWTKLRTAIQAYRHQAQEKKYLEVARILYTLQLFSNPELNENDTRYKQALANYKLAKRQYEESQQKMNEWHQRLKRLETDVAEKGWQDFEQAYLRTDHKSITFDTLQAYQKALEACDLGLLSQETKTLLKVQLGIDLKALQAQIDEDPQAIKNTLQEFFVLNDSDLVSFIKKTHVKRKLTP